MQIRFVAASAVMALALSACGHSASSVVPAARGGASAAPPTAAPSSGAAASAQRSTMTISISIPAKKSSANVRRTQTISPGTAYVDVVLQSLDGDAQPVNGPYSTLVPVSQLGSCGGSGGRAHQRATQSISGCFTVTVPAPVGKAVYAVGALDSGMTLLDYVEGVPVSVTSGGTATLVATLNGVGASVNGYTMLTNPAHDTEFKMQNGVDCPASTVQYEPKAVCSFEFDTLDGSGDNMAASWTPMSHGYLANALAFTATDLTSQQLLNIGFNTSGPSAASPAYEIDFDPANPAGGLSGTTLGAGPLFTYRGVIHPDLGEIPAGSTATIEFKAVVQPPATAAFGPNVLMPRSGAATFTWDLACKNVTVAPNDPSGVAAGTVLAYCLPQESNVQLMVQ